MNLTSEPDLQYPPGGDIFSLPGAFLEPPIEASGPLSLVHNLLGLSHVDFQTFDFANLEPRDLSPKSHISTPLAADNLSGQSAPSLVAEDPTSVSPMPIPGPSAKTTCQNQNPQGQGSCVSAATGIIASMHASSRSCILQVGTSGPGSPGAGGYQPPPARTADAILSMNQAALQAVRSIVTCSCYGRPQVTLLITVICSKIAAWYSRVIYIYSSHGGGPTADSISLSNADSKIEPQRPDFFLGNHRLDEELQTVLIRQVLSGIIRELQLVIADLAGHAGQSPAGVVDANADETLSSSEPMLCAMRGRLTSFLQQQVQKLTSALDETESGLGTRGMPGSRS